MLKLFQREGTDNGVLKQIYLRIEDGHFIGSSMNRNDCPHSFLSLYDNSLKSVKVTPNVFRVTRKYAKVLPQSFQLLVRTVQLCIIDSCEVVRSDLTCTVHLWEQERRILSYSSDDDLSFLGVDVARQMAKFLAESVQWISCTNVLYTGTEIVVAVTALIYTDLRHKNTYINFAYWCFRQYLVQCP